MASNILLYNPDQKSKGEILEEFVLRNQEFNSIFNTLKSSDISHPPQHFLIQGQRGMGKTTLLLRLKYAIEDDQELSAWLLPIRFSEEQYHISALVDLWESLAEMLDANFDGFRDLPAGISQWERAQDFETRASEAIVKALKSKGKRVLVMIDNLGDLFEKMGELESHRLREVLLTHSEIQLLGASTYVLEHHFKYEKAFYEFFQVVPLKPITKEQSIALMRVLAKKFAKEEEMELLLKNQSARMEVLRRFTGGVPRTMALLFGIFMDNPSGTTFESLQLLLDEVNSFYKHRMDELKPQQQRIMDTLAKAWEPISSKQILEQSKLYRADVKSNQISAQLKSMEDNQLIESIEGRGKNKTYRIRERFFNIWYLMRYGKKYHKEEVLWLVKFLEEWCEEEEFSPLQVKELYTVREPSTEYVGGSLCSEIHRLAGLGDWNQVLKTWETALAAGLIISKFPCLQKFIFWLLIGGQFHFLYNQFKKPELELMKYARPYWYALMWFMKDEYPGEYEKVGSELKETVDEIIREIEKGRNTAT